MEWMNGFGESLMYANRPGRRVPEGTYVPLALQVLDLLRTPDEHPEGVLVGAGLCLCWLAPSRATRGPSPMCRRWS